MINRSVIFASFFVLILALVACGSGPTPDPRATDTPGVASPTPTATLADIDLPAPTATPTAAVESPTDTAQPSPTIEPSPTSEPSPTPTEEPAEPTPTATPETQVDLPPTPMPDCENKAAFFADVTIPDDTVMRQEEAFTKTWRVRNEGTCTWADYQLVYAGGEAMNAPPANTIEPTGPGEIVDISVEMQAPKRGGSYTSFWQFAAPGAVNFGVGAHKEGMLWVRVVVDHGSVQTASTSSTTASTGGTSTSPPSGCSFEQDASFVDQIFELVNEARANAGLSTVTLENRLKAAAEKHSIDMACNDFVSHTGSDSSLWYQRVSDQGYANSNSARENIYVGNPAFGGDAQGAFTWWMNSQIHRDNILNPHVSQIGLAYVYNAASTYGGYYTLVVARP